LHTEVAAPTGRARRVHLHDGLRSAWRIRRQADWRAAGEPPVADGVRISVGMCEPLQNDREQERPSRTSTHGGSRYGVRGTDDKSSTATAWTRPDRSARGAASRARTVRVEVPDKSADRVVAESRSTGSARR
jgi:hypothetical protein